MADFQEPVFSNFKIILKQPKYSENIGSAARAMRNMGLSDLVLVAPIKFEPDKAKKTATHESLNILADLKIVNTIKDAIAECHYVVGTSARTGKQRHEVFSPSEIALKLSSLSTNNKIGILFGTEASGLQNDDLAYCDCLINIPSSDFSSINLAQSVMIICYELYKTSHEQKLEQLPQLVRKKELSNLYDNLEKVLIKTGYTNPENPSYTLSGFRRFFSRIGLLSREAVIINSLMKRILAHTNNCNSD